MSDSYKHQMENEVKDCHQIEIFDQLGLDPRTQSHLYVVIDEFVRMKAKENLHGGWHCRIHIDGVVYWVNEAQQEASNNYPYLKELELKISKYEKGINGKHARFRKDKMVISQMIPDTDFLYKKLPMLRVETFNL